MELFKVATAWSNLAYFLKALRSQNKQIGRCWKSSLVSILVVLLTACSSGGGGGNDSAPMNSDTTAPTAIITPSDADFDLDTAIAITVNFSEDIIASTVHETSFTLSDDDGVAIDATVTFDAVNNVATLTPDSTLGVLKTYTSQLNTDVPNTDSKITDLSGNLLASTSTQFTTRDGEWNGPVLLIDGGSGNDSSRAQIEVAPNGDAVALYQSSGDLYANHYSVTEGWSTKIQINNIGSEFTFADSPDVVMDAQGNAMVVWSEVTNAASSIYANRYTVGNGWGSAQLIETTDAENANAPQLAVDSYGNVTVVWDQTNGSGYRDIWINYYFKATAEWGEAREYKTVNVDVSNADIAISQNGISIITWEQGNDLYFDFYCCVGGLENYGNSGYISSAITSDTTDSKIVFDSDNNATIVWSEGDPDGGSFDLYSRYLTAGSTIWSDATLITSDSILPSYDMAVDPYGNVIMVWRQDSSIMANRYSKFSGSWEDTATEIENNPNYVFSIPNIAVTGTNMFTVIWSQIGESGNVDVYTNRFTPADGWDETEVELIESSPGITYQPTIGIDENGRAIAIWIQENGGRNAALIRHFN